jgi:DNA polymerase-4
LAKLASDLDKPNGFRVIEEHEVRETLDPLPVEKIFGVGERTAKRLHQLGVETVGDLAGLERGEVVRRFGASGVWIHDLAHGIDPRRVNPHREEKSHGMERTFAEDISDPEELRTLLLSFCEEVGFGLRGRGLRGRTVTLKVRYSDFKTRTRTRTLELPTNLGPRLFSVASELLERVPGGPLRLLGVQVSQLEDVRQPIQGDLFESQLTPTRSQDQWIQTNERLEQATRSMDKLRRKYGRLAVQPAALLGRPALSGRTAPRQAPAAGAGAEPADSEED